MRHRDSQLYEGAVSPCHDVELRQITQNRVLEDTNFLQDVEEIDTYTCLEHHHHGRVGTCVYQNGCSISPCEGGFKLVINEYG